MRPHHLRALRTVPASEDALEFALSILLLLATFFCGWSLLRRRVRGRGVWLAALALCVLCGTVFVASVAGLYAPPVPESRIEHRPIEAATDGYSRSDSCRACHPGQYASWRDSYHSSMTQVAQPDTVLGDFDDRVLRLGGMTFRLSRRGDEFWVDMPDLDTGSGLRVQRQILLTTGSHHMQAYWYGTDNTRVLGLLPFVHNVEMGDWFPRMASFVIPPRETPQSEMGRWNKVCLECHVTRGRLRPIETEEYAGHDTRVAEFGIACEACHGPGEAHVAANGNALGRYAARFSDRPQKNIVLPSRLDHRRSAEVCGQCHSTSVWTNQEAIDEFMENGFEYRPGDVLADSKAVVRGKYEWNSPDVQNALSHQLDLLPNTFWADGMNRITGREYNGLLETPCYRRGTMSCLSCHRLHPDGNDARPVAEWTDDQLKPGMRGNPACTQCHERFAEPDAVAAHSHHPAGSSGSVCYNCHMPFTAYGLLSAVRSHQVDSPSVQANLETGRPIACNQCHLDRTKAWTAERLEAWYGIPQAELLPVQRNVADIPLMALQGDAGQRALAAWSLGWPVAHEASGNDWEGLFLGILLADPYPAVRAISARSLARLPGFEGFEYDPVAPTRERQELANAVLERWARVQVSQSRDVRPPLLMDYNGPRMDLLLNLLQQRNDRPVTFAE